MIAGHLGTPPGDGISPTAVGFFGMSPQPQSTGYVQGYTPMAKTTPAYTANSQAVAYVGGLLNLLDAGRLVDLNALRVAVENLRTMTEAMAKQHNQLIDDLKTMGLIG